MNWKYIILVAATSMLEYGCENYLDITPPSDITPEVYFTDVSDLEAYMMGRYGTFNPNSNYGFSGDNGTDNQISKDYNALYTLDESKVPSGSNWDFSGIYAVNWFLDQVLPKWEKGEISGNENEVKHFIGEAYFFRAWYYYQNVKRFGDFPIIEKALPDDKEILIKASVRYPRTDVIHFILSDLEKSIEYMSEQPRHNKTTLWKGVAYLMKSRVALYEGTWLKYFKDTPFVPNGEGWPGKDTWPDWEYPEGNLEAEVNWLFGQAMDASDKIASTVQLASNSKILPQSISEHNDYLEMFGALDMSGYDEILLWKQYSQSLGIANGTAQYAASGNADLGLTRGMVSAFLMEDGLPFYAASAEKPYKGDRSIGSIIQNRDNRMMLFVKQPGQINGYINIDTENTEGYKEEPYPKITGSTYGYYYPTGYASRKGWNPDMGQWRNLQSSCGYPVFRAVEAYLNYIEACYERTGKIDEKADKYWKEIRKRGGVDEDYTVTIEATSMQEEAKYDWGAYSEGRLVDATLYNIRRERRVELMLEGFRWDDLYRWRALDQLETTPYHLEGFRIWDSDMTDWYNDLDYTSSEANVTSPSESDYIRVWEIRKQNNPISTQNGVKWKKGHYLSPVGIDEFRKTSYQNEGYTDSPVYQNPYWTMEPNSTATE
ncbi:RagB/SusD family nutrient uptake outer membrane protein [Phocaeicola plebeius]|uniref:RagB/SusD family nutrient uptake outer membrane protein n=1 Tax=Phocaeicola plebeius TaxID=310297 RepID=UPI00307AE4D6